MSTASSPSTSVPSTVKTSHDMALKLKAWKAEKAAKAALEKSAKAGKPQPFRVPCTNNSPMRGAAAVNVSSENVPCMAPQGKTPLKAQKPAPPRAALTEKCSNTDAPARANPVCPRSVSPNLDRYNPAPRGLRTKTPERTREPLRTKTPERTREALPTKTPDRMHPSSSERASRTKTPERMRTEQPAGRCGAKTPERKFQSRPSPERQQSQSTLEQAHKPSESSSSAQAAAPAYFGALKYTAPAEAKVDTQARLTEEENERGIEAAANQVREQPPPLPPPCEEPPAEAAAEVSALELSLLPSPSPAKPCSRDTEKSTGLESHCILSSPRKGESRPGEPLPSASEHGLPASLLPPHPVVEASIAQDEDRSAEVATHSAPSSATVPTDGKIHKDKNEVSRCDDLAGNTDTARGSIDASRTTADDAVESAPPMLPAACFSPRPRSPPAVPVPEEGNLLAAYLPASSPCVRSSIGGACIGASSPSVAARVGGGLAAAYEERAALPKMPPPSPATPSEHMAYAMASAARIPSLANVEAAEFARAAGAALVRLTTEEPSCLASPSASPEVRGASTPPPPLSPLSLDSGSPGRKEDEVKLEA